MKSYLKNIRSKIGNEKFICPGARIIIENKQGEYLFIKRIDNGNLGIPAGSIEANETIEECIIREVKEETGLTILNPEVIGISSNPTLETVQYPNGDITVYFTIEFYTSKYSGELKADGIETSIVEFKVPKHIDQLPKNEKSTFDSLAFYKSKGKIKVK